MPSAAGWVRAASPADGTQSRHGVLAIVALLEIAVPESSSEIAGKTGIARGACMTDVQKSNTVADGDVSTRLQSTTW